MRALTPAERRGVLLIAGLFLLGAAYDLWRASRPAPSLGDPVATLAPDSLARPSIPRAAADPEARPTFQPGAVGVARLDLNRATATELESLDGIGPKLAGRILEHRRLHGPFQSVEELLAVRGIGPRLLQRIRPQVEVRAVAR